MTLSGHTSTLPRVVVWGAGFQGNFLDLAKTQFCALTGTYLDRGRETVSVSHLNCFYYANARVGHAQREHPLARVVYVSATGASKLEHMGYVSHT